MFGPIRNLSYGSFRQSLTPIAYALLLWLPFGLAQANWSNADMHGYHDAEILAREVFKTCQAERGDLLLVGAE